MNVLKRRWWRKSFKEGFLTRELLVRAMLGVVIGIVYLFLTPARRTIQPEDWVSYRYVFTHEEMFPALLASLLLVLAPIVNLAYFSFLMRKRLPRDSILREAVYFFLASSLCMEVTVLMCEAVKRMVGRLRPDYLSRCYNVYDPPSLITLSQSFTAPVIVGECNNPTLSEAQILDGRMSFPSEHSATAMAVFVSIALWDFMMIRSVSGGAETLVLPALIILIPLSIAISRSRDYRHHSTDIMAGLAIGTSLSIACFAFYFPRTSPRPGKPEIDSSHKSTEYGTNGETDLEGSHTSLDNLD